MNRNRKIGLPLATLLVAGNMIGSGVYLLPASLAAVGSITVISWVIALIAALAIAGVLAYLGRIAPEAGGLCGYARAALGPFVGFQSSVFYWACCWIGNVAIALAAIGYLAKLVPSLNQPVLQACAVIALVWFVTVLNIVGPRFACQMQSLALAVGIVPILLIATLGWLRFDPATFAQSWNVTDRADWQVIPGALVLVFWAFLGLESASVGTAVVENPQRNVPLATMLGVALAGIVYIAAFTAIMGMLPASQLVQSTAPFADAAQLLTGSVVGSIVALLAFVKATGTLSGLVLVTAQAGKTAAEQQLFPSIFARVDRDGIPVANYVLMAVLMSAVMLLTTSPAINQQFNRLAEMSVLLCLVSYAYACIAIWRLRPANGRTSMQYHLMAALALAMCIWIAAMSGATVLWWAFWIAAAVSACYLIIMRRQLGAVATDR